MPSVGNVSIAKIMAPLRERYLESLSPICDDLKNMLHGLQEARMSPALVDHLARLAHNIAGSGGSYGFPDISWKARALEECLRGQSVDRDEIIALLRELITTCEKILNRPVKVSLQQFVAARPEAQALATVLVVDSNQEIRRMFGSLLADSATVVSARTAAEAFTIIEKARPDLILLDDQMPDSLSGLTMLEELRLKPDYRHIPVIMVTANNDVTKVQRIANSNVRDYLVKPIQPQQAAERVKAHLRRLRTSVLVVDDDNAIRALLYNVFIAAGFQTRMAENGFEALDQMRDSAPDIVLLDYQMPGMDGPAVLEAMKGDETLADALVVFLTGKRDVEDVTRALKLGAIDYIVKPCAPQNVLKRCLQVLAAHRDRQRQHI